MSRPRRSTSNGAFPRRQAGRRPGTPTSAPRPLLFEPLEPRLLLAGDPIIGTAAADILNGTPDDELIQGLGAADVLTGFGGNDRLEGGAGDDVYKFGNDWGIDTVVELDGQGTDTLDFGAVSGPLTISVDPAGRVTVTQGANSVTAEHVEKLIGGTGQDLLDLSAIASGLTITLKPTGEVVVAGGASLSVFGIEDLTGGAGDDTVIFQKGALLEGTLDGGAGQNTLAYSDPAAPDTSSAGFDASVRVVLPGGAGGADGRATAVDGFAIGGLRNFGSVVGGRGDDRLTGSDAANTLTGGGGDDTLTGLDANDSLVGGAGHDTLSGGAGDDFLRGDGAAATLPDSNDLLVGGAGDDTLIGGAGHDRYVFGPGWGQDTVIEATDDGRDTFDFGNVTVALEVAIDAAAGVSVTTGGADPQTVSGASIEVVVGGQGADTYTFGPTWANEITIEDSDPGAPSTVLDFGQVAAHLTILVAAGATPGGNTVTVVGGSHTVTARNVARVIGGDGDDIFVFEAGGTIRDVDGGGGANRLSYLAYDGAVDVDLAAGRATGVLGSLASIQSARGGARGDTVLGADDARQTLFGEGGDDHVEAGQHAADMPGDTLDGGPGDDTLVGGDGRDHLAGDLGDDTFRAGASADTLEGGAGNDRLDGEAGADLLTGGAGNDTLVGGAGDDTLAGGAGDDTYLFGSGWGQDRVEGAADGRDTVDFSGVSEGLTHSVFGNVLTSGTGVFTRGPDLDVSLEPTDLVTIKQTHGDFEAGANKATVLDFDRVVTGTGANGFLFEGVRSLEIDARGAGSLTLDFQAVADGLEFVFTTDQATGITTLTITEDSIIEKAKAFFTRTTQPTITVIGVDADTTIIGGRNENVFAVKDGATFAGTIEGGTGKKLTTIPLTDTVIPDPTRLLVVNALDYSDDNFTRPKIANLSGLIPSLQTATGFTGTIHGVDEIRYGPSVLNVFLGTNASPSGLGSDTFTPGSFSVPLLDAGIPTPGIHVFAGGTGADTYEFRNLWGFGAVIEPPDVEFDGVAAPEFFDTLDFSGVLGDLRIEIDQVTTGNLNFLSGLLPADIDFDLTIGTNFLTVTELGPSQLLRDALAAVGVSTDFLDSYVPSGTSRLYALDIENIVGSSFGTTTIVMKNGAVLKGTVEGDIDLDYSQYYDSTHTGPGVDVHAGAGAELVLTPEVSVGSLTIPSDTEIYGRATGILGHRLSGATDLLVQTLELLGAGGAADGISAFLADFAVKGIQNVVGTPFADSLVGSFEANVLTSLGGDDTIDGYGASRFTLDFLGDLPVEADTVSFAGIATRVDVDLAAGTATVYASDGTTVAATLALSDLRHVVAGTGGGTLAGDAADNTFRVGDAFGSITLATGGGRDTIDVSAVPGSVTAETTAPGQLEVTAGASTIAATGDVEVKGRDGQVTFVPLDLALGENAVLLLDGAPGSATTELTEAELTAIVAAAVERWRAAGALPASATDDELDGLVLEIADLAGAELARQDPATGAIQIDPTAAGLGWFVDGSPDEDAEFEAGVATAGGPAEGKVDLLTVVMHEVGHVLQLGHATSGLGLMADALAASERRLPPAAAEVAALVASDEAALSLGLGAFADWVAGLGPRLEALFTADPIPFVDLSFADLFGIDPTIGARVFDAVAADVRDQVQAVFDGAAGPLTTADLATIPGIERVASSNPKEYRATLNLFTYFDELAPDFDGLTFAGFGLRSSDAFSLDLRASLDLDFLFGIDDGGEFYVRDPGVTAGLFLGHDADNDGEADPFDLEIGFGFVGAGIDDGTLELEASLRLGADGRLGYADLVGDTVSPLDFRPALAADSHYVVDLPIGLTGVLSGLSGDGARLYAASDEVPAFGSFADFFLGAGSFGGLELEAINLDQVLSLRGVSLDALLDGLSQALDALAEPDGPLYDEIPLVDTSIAGLLGSGTDDFVLSLKKAVDAARDGLENIQDVEAALNAALVDAFGPGADIASLSYEDSTLLLTLELERTFSDSIPFDLSLSDLIPALGDLVDLSSDGTIDVLATGEIGLGVGLDLSDVLAPELFFTDDTRIVATLDITTSEPIDLAATVSLPAVGDVGFTVQDGTVAVHLGARFGLAGADDGRYGLGELAGSLEAVADGSLAIDLPLFFPTPALPMGGSTQDRDGDGVADNVLHVAAGFGLAEGLGPFEVVAPDFAASFDLFAFLDDPANILAGLEGMFDAIKGGLESRFAQMALPLIDDKLAAAAEFVDTALRAPFLGVEDHEAGLDDPARYAPGSLGRTLQDGAASGDSTVDLIRQALFSQLGDLLVVPDRAADGDLQFDDLGRIRYRPVESAEDIELVLSATGIQFNVLVAGTIFEEQVPLSFDLSAPGFGLSAEDADLNLLLTYTFGLGFGFDRAVGLYLDTSGVTESGAELSLDLSATLGSDATFTGQLTFLQVALEEMSGADAALYGVAPDTDGASGLFASISLDLIDDGGDDRWAIFGETLEVSANLTAFANVDLGAQVSIEGTGIALPEVRTVVHYDQTFLDVTLSSSSGSSVDVGGSPTVVFENVTLDLGKALSGFVGPIADELDKYIGPETEIRRIIDLLTTPVDLGITTLTLLDIARLKLSPAEFGAVETAIEAIKTFSDFIGLVAASEGESIEISFGDFTVGGSLLSSPTAAVQASDTKGSRRPDLDAATDGKAGSKEVVKKFGVEPGSIQFPILQDPSSVLGLLLGRRVDLFVYDLPDLFFEVGYRQTFPIYPGLNAIIGGAVSGRTDLSFGFDTTGLNAWKELDFALGDVDTIFDGFYFGDWDSAGNEKPEVTLTAELRAGASLGIGGLVEAGVEGGIIATVELDLADVPEPGTGVNTIPPVYDGRLYFDEIGQRIQQSPLCLFDIHGDLRAFLEAFFWVGVDVGFFEITIFEARQRFVDVLLAEFDHFCPPPVADVAALSGRTLEVRFIEEGAVAPGQVAEDYRIAMVERDFTDDGVDNPTDWIQVTGNGALEFFDPEDVDTILILGSSHDDRYVIDASVDKDIDIRGGAGNDRIDVRSAAPGRMRLVDGGSGDDEIKGGAGADTIRGGAGRDTITGNGGADTLEGGHDDDFIVGGDASDTIEGGAGNDTITAGGGHDVVWGGAGNDVIDGGEGNDLLYGVGPLAAANAEAGNARNRDVLLGRGGSDTLVGGDGDDLIVGGTGLLDVVSGGAGTDAFVWTAGDSAQTIHGDTAGAPPSAFEDTVRMLGYARDAQGEVVDAGQADLVDVSADGADVAASWNGITLDLHGIRILDVDTGAGADAVTLGELRGTALTRANLTLGSARTVVEEARQPLDEHGNPIELLDDDGNPTLDIFRITQKANDAAGDVVTIRGEGGSDRYVLTDEAELDPENGNAVQYLRAVQESGVTVEVREIGFAEDRLVIDAGAGDDEIDASGLEADLVDDLRLLGGEGNDRLVGSRFTEILIGGAGADVITGGAGVDLFVHADHPEVAREADASGAPVIDTLVEQRDADFHLSDASITIGSEVEALADHFERVELRGGDSANRFTLAGWTRNGLIDGGQGGDTYDFEVARSGVGTNFLNVNDTGVSGIDEMVYRGSAGDDLIQLDTVYERAQDPAREFTGDRWLGYGAHGDGLLVVHFASDSSGYEKKDLEDTEALFEVAAVNLAGGADFQVVNYSTVELVTVFAGQGDDKIVSDDTAQTLNVYGNQGDDQFYVGSVLETEDVLVEGREVTVVVQITRGASFQMSFYGGDGDDYFEVNHNAADISLFGDNGDDTFFVKALLTLDEDEEVMEVANKVATVSGVTGEGSEEAQRDNDTRQVDLDSLVYVENANVRIDGGAGFDAVAIVGTVLADTFYVFTEVEDGQVVQRIFGAGVKLRELINVERVLLLTGGGDDRVFVYGVDLGPVADLVINTGTGSDTVQFGGPERTIELAFPAQSRTEFASVNGYEEGDFREIAFDLGIQFVDALGRVVPFDVDEPAHTRLKTIAAAQSIEGIRSPVLVRDVEGLLDTVVFDNGAGPTALVLADRELRRKTIATDADLVIYPAATGEASGLTDLIARLGSLAEAGRAVVVEQVNGYLEQQILFTDRYFDPALIGRLLALAGAETETVTIPAGIAYAVFQDALDAGGDIVTARAQLETFLAGTGFSVEYVTAPHPDPSRTDLLFDVVRIANADGAELAFEGQYRELVKDGVVFRDLIGVALVTAAPADVEVQAGYVTDVEVVDTEAWHSLYAEGEAPTIYFDDVEEVRIDLNAAEASTFTLDDDRFAGRTTVQGGDASDTFRVVSLAGETFLRGGDGDDRFEVGTGTLDAIGGALFLIGEAGTDAVEVLAQDEADADALLDRNTVVHTVEQDQLSKVTNALEFRNVTAEETALIAEALKAESVTHALLAAAVSPAHLEAIASRAASDAGLAIESALFAASAEFEAAIDALVARQRGDYETFLAGVLEEYRGARLAKDVAQAQYNAIAGQANAAQALINTLDFLLGIIPGAPSVAQLVANPSLASGLGSGLVSTLRSLVDLVNRAKNLQQAVQTESQRQAGAEALLDDNGITTGERGSYFTNRQNGATAGVAAAAILDNSAAVQSRLAGIEQGLRSAAAPTIARIEATLAEVRRLGLATADVATTVPLVLSALDGLIAHLESGSAGEADRWVRLERLELVKDVLVAAERALLGQVADLLAAIPGQAAFDGAAAFLADASPDFDAATALFDDAGFEQLIAAYRAAREIAEDFVDYGTDDFAAFRSAVRHMDRFEVFKTYLQPGFDFARFRADYQANVAQLDDNLALFADLALEAQYEAKLASLHHDQDQVHAIANHNDAVRDFFLSLRQEAQADFGDIDAALKSAYTVTISAFGFTFASIQLDHTRDVRYKNALALRDAAVARDNTAGTLRAEANATRGVIDAEVADLEQRLADLRARIADDRAALDALHDTLESQYRFLRSLSPVAVQVLTQTRGGEAAADFEDTSSLISEVLTHADTYVVGDETPLAVREEVFLPGPTSASVVKRTTIVESFQVLTLSGLNGAGVHADYESVERLTLRLGDTDDAVRVHDSLGQAGSRVVVEAGGGADAITLASEAGSVDRYVGDVYVDAGAGGNRLLVDDHGDATGDTVLQDHAAGYVRLSGMADGQIFYRATGGDFALGLHVLTSSGSDDVTIRGLHGGDHTEIDLGAGDDRITVEGFDVDPAATLTIHGRSGDDVVHAALAPLGITAYGHAGDDLLRGSAHADLLSGDEGDDTLLGGPGDDTLLGGLGDDDLVGGSDQAGALDGADLLDGGAGDDVIAGDNALITRRGDTVTPLVRSLSGTVIYVGAAAQVTAASQADPTGTAARSITLLDHSPAAPAGTSGGDDIAGGAGRDLLFGQMGDDVIHGDAAHPSSGDDEDGDDYVEGGGGADTIFGNGGQDDLIGGSSSLFGLDGADQRPDGADLIFGGSGTLTGRNDPGDTSAEGHAADADVIVGDNGNVYRLVGTTGTFLHFNYDTYSALVQVIARAVELLDHAADDTGLGAGDVLHGEAGDDTIHGGTGDDVLFGHGQDDDLYGEGGNDWISGGTGDDAVLGDTGLVLTSRNGTAEPLYGIAQTTEQSISVPGGVLEATINVTGELKKAVDLEPFEVGGDDTVYGGLGDDSLHGGAGHDAMSGGEALPEFFSAPWSTPRLLIDAATERFVDFDDADPLAKIAGHPLDFDAAEADGDDALFGDEGHDWLVGGTGQDHLYGGMGNDILDTDDDIETTGADTGASAEADTAFGGGGNDTLIGASQADRLIDWVGQANLFATPSGGGQPVIIRSPAPHFSEFLYGLAESDGADQTRVGPGLGTAERRGEPYGELGAVTQRDPQWRDQTGGRT